MIKIYKGQKVTDGAGVKINRIIGSNHIDHLDPFMLLDEIKGDNPDDFKKGFPMHPHRGIETVTYMVEGRFKHRDSKGNEGWVSSGEVQWMRAGRGILHEEMPASDGGMVWGYQLWLNLPSAHKMIAPEYHFLHSTEIGHFASDGLEVHVISGEFEGVKGPGKTMFPVEFFDVYLEKGHFFKHLHPSAFLYMHSGSAEVRTNGESVKVHQGELCVLLDLESVEVVSEDAGFLFLSSEPHREPIVKYGPFVMNTREEIEKAMDDYKKGTLHL